MEPYSLRGTGSFHPTGGYNRSFTRHPPPQVFALQDNIVSFFSLWMKAVVAFREPQPPSCSHTDFSLISPHAVEERGKEPEQHGEMRGLATRSHHYL